jgi:hypothetical protein
VDGRFRPRDGPKRDRGVISLRSEENNSYPVSHGHDAAGWRRGHGVRSSNGPCSRRKGTKRRRTLRPPRARDSSPAEAGSRVGALLGSGASSALDATNGWLLPATRTSAAPANSATATPASVGHPFLTKLSPQSRLSGCEVARYYALTSGHGSPDGLAAGERRGEGHSRYGQVQ